MTEANTFLMFVGEQCGKAEEAIRRYTSLFPDSEIGSMERYADGDPGGPAGMIKLATFTLTGQRFMASDSAGPHEFTFTPSISVFVNCADRAEQAHLFAELSQRGNVLMALADYGFSQQFGWVADAYGVSWQLNLA